VNEFNSGDEAKTSADAFVQAALEEVIRGDSDAALAELEQALERNPLHGQAWYTKGCIYSERRQFALAVGCYEKSAENAPDHAAIPLFNLGNAYRELGDSENASMAFLRATEADPTMSDAWINLGRELDDGGEHQRAVQCYDVALEIAPEDSDALKNRGNSLAALDQFEEAEKSYHLAIESDPREAQAMIGLAQCLRNQERYQEGLQWIDNSLEITPDPLALIEKTRLLHESQQLEEALELIDYLFGLGLEHPAFYVFKGEILGELARNEDAVLEYDHALERDPLYLPALFRKAEQLVALGRYDDAKATLAQYFENTTDDDEDRDDAEALRGTLLANRLETEIRNRETLED